MTLKNLKSVQKTLGLLLMVFSITMLTPVAVALIYQEQNIAPF
jgi:Trk-type K+ transport system membrane component